MMIQSDLLKNSQITHGFFTREGGVSTGLYTGLNCGAGSKDDPLAVIENKKRVCQKLEVQTLNTLYQIHSADVVLIDDKTDTETRVQADAMVTTTPGIALGILTADCVPILFSDPVNRVIGAAHSGWKGTLGNIAANVIDKMITLGANRDTISVAIGPAIQQASYEVGPEFPTPFEHKDKSFSQYFRPSVNDGHFQFDLTGFVRDRILSLDVKSVDLIDLDTYTHEQQFYSYRRMCHRKEADYGRQISAIALQV